MEIGCLEATVTEVTVFMMITANGNMKLGATVSMIHTEIGNMKLEATGFMIHREIG
jgi:hypothetical protein